MQICRGNMLMFKIITVIKDKTRQANEEPPGRAGADRHPLSRFYSNLPYMLAQLCQPLWDSVFLASPQSLPTCGFSFRLYVNWRFMRGIEAQFLALQKGFNELIPQHLLKPFDQKELEVSETTGNPVQWACCWEAKGL